MTKTPGERITATEKDIEKILEALKVIRDDVDEVKASAVASERMLRWATGAAAAFGAMGAMLLPKIKTALGLG